MQLQLPGLPRMDQDRPGCWGRVSWDLAHMGRLALLYQGQLLLPLLQPLPLHVVLLLLLLLLLLLQLLLPVTLDPLVPPQLARACCSHNNWSQMHTSPGSLSCSKAHSRNSCCRCSRSN